MKAVMVKMVIAVVRSLTDDDDIDASLVPPFDTSPVPPFTESS